MDLINLTVHEQGAQGDQHRIEGMRRIMNKIKTLEMEALSRIWGVSKNNQQAMKTALRTIKTAMQQIRLQEMSQLNPVAEAPWVAKFLLFFMTMPLQLMQDEDLI